MPINPYRLGNVRCDMTFRGLSAVPSTRFQCSVKAFTAIINVNDVRARDVTANETVLADVDMMLDCLASSST